MTTEQIRAMLLEVQQGKLPIEVAVQQFGTPSVGDLGFAQVDLERRVRCGFPEVIFCEGKTPAWTEGVVRRLVEAQQDCLGTRVNDEQATHLARCFPQAEQDRVARTFWLPTSAERPPTIGRVFVVTAGTGDIPVAREAYVTAKVMGTEVELVADVGVAGLHRILRQRQAIAQADAIVVCAGMDGALPSVVGGLADCPVIAVPTSIGYGTAFHGVAPLLTMLNACAANVCVVNIDAGFKGGYIAALIARNSRKKGE